MTMRHVFHGIGLFIFCTTIGFAQVRPDEKKNIETEVVRVEKPYVPTLQEVVKLRELPVSDSMTIEKRKIMYQFLNFPVASTFVPAKAKPTAPPRPKREKLYSHFASLGIGSFGNVDGNFYGNWELSRQQSLSYQLNHQSTQGGIDGIKLDDKFYDTQIGVDFINEEQDRTQSAYFKVQHQNYNWYGLPNLAIPDETIDTIDEPQTYFGIAAGGELLFEESPVEKVKAGYQGFFDDFSSSEHNLNGSIDFNLHVSDYFLHHQVVLDYLNGSFDRNFDNTSELSYNIINVGYTPTYRYDFGNVSAEVGLSLFYSTDTDNNDNSFYIYPKITASYRPVGDIIWLYGGLEGGLHQNSYYQFVQNNFFVSPTLTVKPTDNRYDLYAGLKGKVASRISYNVKAAYRKDRDKALYRLNPLNTIDPTEGYEYGNSFDVVYDDVETFTFSGALQADWKPFDLLLQGEFFDYSADREQEAWNLPDVKITFKGDYQFDSKWKFGAEIFYVGERFDLFQSKDVNFPAQKITLDSYLDINLRGSYQYSPQLSFFGKINNLTGQDYERFSNFEVQGIQVMAGAAYKFDF